MDYQIYTSSADSRTAADNTCSSLTNSERLCQLAKQTKFQQRNRGKITPEIFVDTITEAAFKQAVSFRQLAVLGGCQADDTLAKQSVWERVNSRAANFLGAVLCDRMIGDKIDLPEGVATVANRILIHDSTTVKLHPSLHGEFPGASNQSGTAQACARIQVTADLLAGEFLQFGLSGFTRNDQAASKDILSTINAGDLILRDLGYFALKSFEAIDHVNAFFLSRLRHGTALFDEHGERINLLKELRRAADRGASRVILEAAMGCATKLPVRVVAIRLPSQVANERRRKARADRDKRISHDDAYYELLGWTILVTNLPQRSVAEIDLAELYGLRWRIENIFKAWKGGIQPGRLSAHRSNPWHLRCLLLGQMLALADLSRIGIFSICGDDPSGGTDPILGHPTISLFKALDTILLCGQSKNLPDLQRDIHRQISYHGRYEKRKRTPLPMSPHLR